MVYKPVRRTALPTALHSPNLLSAVVPVTVCVVLPVSLWKESLHHLPTVVKMKILSLAVLCVLVSVANARSTGAPDPACADIAPSPSAHGTPQDPLANPSPYSITIDPFPANGQFTPGATYTITLSACGNSTTTFRGFLISPVNINEERQGTWTILDSDRTQTTCADNRGLTHTDGMDKTNITAMWTAPAAGSGDILFRYAAVQVQRTNWANIYEATLSDPSERSGAATTYGSKILLFIGSILVLTLAL